MLKIEWLGYIVGDDVLGRVKKFIEIKAPPREVGNAGFRQVYRMDG